MGVLIQVVGGIVVALMIRGAIGFWQDYRSRR